MLIYFLIFQGLALILYVPFWFDWTGRNRSWVESNFGFGWLVLLLAAFGTFFQSMAFGAPGLIAEGTVFGDTLSAISTVLLVVVMPLFFYGSFLPVPRFLLPKWIRERRAAGDPVRTENPLPQIQHLMTHPRNLEAQQQLTLSPEQRRLPQRFRVNLVRWWVSVVLMLGFGGLGALFVLNPFLELFTTTQPGLVGVLTVLAVPFTVLLLGAGLYYLRGALVPEHLSVDAHGVSTRSWSLEWGQIRGMRFSPGRVWFEVDEQTARRLAQANRWHSGRPLGLGGMVCTEPRIGTQLSLKNLGQAALLIREQLPQASTVPELLPRAQTEEQNPAWSPLPQDPPAGTARWSWTGTWSWSSTDPRP